MLDELAFDMPALGNVASAVADGSRLNEVEDSALRGLTPPAPEDEFSLSPGECAESFTVPGECAAME
jgi:hypothetical protein